MIQNCSSCDILTPETNLLLSLRAHLKFEATTLTDLRVSGGGEWGMLGVDGVGVKRAFLYLFFDLGEAGYLLLVYIPAAPVRGC